MDGGEQDRREQLEWEIEWAQSFVNSLFEEDEENTVGDDKDLPAFSFSRNELDELLRVFRKAKSDIWQTARVSETNLTGKDPCFPLDAVHKPDPPKLITRRGIDESYGVVDEIAEAMKIIYSKIHEYE